MKYSGVEMSTPYYLSRFNCGRRENFLNWFIERKKTLADKSLCKQILKIQASRLLESIIHVVEKIYCLKIGGKALHLTFG